MPCRHLGPGFESQEFPEGLPFNTDARAIQGLGFLNLTTPYGDLDLTLMPAGTSGYPDLVQQAVVGHVGPIAVRVASLDDIIRSKTAAGRPKDIRALPKLHALRSSRKDNPAASGLESSLSSTDAQPDEFPLRDR